MHCTVLLILFAGLSLFAFSSCQRQQALFQRSSASYGSPVGEESLTGYRPMGTFPVSRAPRPIQTESLSQLTVSNRSQSTQQNRLRRRMVTIQTMLKAAYPTTAATVLKSELSEKGSIRAVNRPTSRPATSIKQASGEDVSIVMFLVGGALLYLGFRANSGFLMIVGLLAMGISAIVAFVSWVSHQVNSAGKTTSGRL